MPTFKFDDFYIEAEDRQEAELIHRSVFLKGDDSKFILIRTPNRVDIIDIPQEGSVQIYLKNGKTVHNCGTIKGGTGEKILRAAVESMAVNEREKGKLSHAVRSANRKRKHASEQEWIKEFESTVPKNIESVYHDVMNRIDATTTAYKIEIIEGITDGGCETVPGESWLPILNWFKEKVLSEQESLPVRMRQNFFVLRRSFVKAAVRMIKGGVHSSNTMKMVLDEHRGDDFWNKYAQGKM